MGSANRSTEHVFGAPGFPLKPCCHSVSFLMKPEGIYRCLLLLASLLKQIAPEPAALG